MYTNTKSTEEARELKKALEKEGVEVKDEFFDGYKHVDLRLPDAKIDVEVDGLHHFIDPEQMYRDVNRSYYSHNNKFRTIHIANNIVRKHLYSVAHALAKVVEKVKNNFSRKNKHD